MTPIKNEAGIDFGRAKVKFLTSMYNWRISYLDETIYIVLADITACFHFPRILADITGAFGFVADDFFFLAKIHVFGSNTSASSWEPLLRSIEALTPVYMYDSSLVEKHAELLSMIKWDESNINAPKLARTRARLTKEYLIRTAFCYPRLEISTLTTSFQLDLCGITC
jgi:hypothetical protein